MAGQDIPDGKFDVLHQQMERPAAALIQYLLRKKEPGAGNGAAAADGLPGAVQVAAFPQKPQGIPGADPVAAVIFAVAVAGDDLIAGRKALVHAGKEIRGDEIIGIKDKVGIEPVGIVRADMRQQRFKGVALPYRRFILPAVNNSALLRGDLGGAVGAVISDDKHRHQGKVVVLPVQAVQQVPDDCFLIAGGHQHRKAVGPGGGKVLFPAQEGNGDIDKLIGIADKKQDTDHLIDGFQSNSHKRSSVPGQTVLWYGYSVTMKRLRNNHRAY